MGRKMKGKDAKYCKGCVHCENFVDGEVCCMYVANMHELRPCKPGVGCTVRKVRKKPRNTTFRERNFKKEEA